MLYLSADATGDVELGAHGDAGLTNLTVVVGKAGIHGSTAGTYLAMQFLGQVEEELEILARAYAIASGHHDGCSLEVVLGTLHVALNDLHHIVGVGYILGHVVTNNLALMVSIEDFLLHHALTHGSHLRAVLGVDDGGHDVATKGGTNLVEQALVVLACFLVVVLTNLEGCAVGGETTMQGR